MDRITSEPGFGKIDKVTEHLFIGDLKAAQDPEELQKHYITHIIAIGKDLTPMYPMQFIYMVLNLMEETTENIAKHFNAVCKWVSKAIRRDSANVLIHCNTGNNLAVCFITAYLIKVENYPIGSALKLIKKARPKIKPYGVFLSQLQSYETIVAAYNKRLEAQKAQSGVRQH